MATQNRRPGGYNVKAVHTSNVASLSGTGTYGGVALAAGELVLLTAQTAPAENGPYVVRSGAWDRIAHWGTLRAGDSWFCEAGTNAAKTYQLTTAGAIVLGTTSLTIAQAGGGGMAGAAHASTHLAGGADPLLAAPGAIGGTTPAAGTFTTLQANGVLTLGTDVSLAKEVNHTIKVAASTTAATSGGALVHEAGDGNGAAGGSYYADAGTGTTGGNVVLGGTKAEAVNLGRTGKTITAVGPLFAAEGQTLAGTAPAAAADRVQYGVVDQNGATTAAEKSIYEGGGSLTRRVQGGAVKVLEIDQELADDATIALPAPSSDHVGRLEICTETEGGLVAIQTDGTCTKISGSSNLEVTDSDTDLCVFKSGSTPTIRNRLGGPNWISATYTWS